MPVSLPPTLYKPSEKNEGDKSQVRNQNLFMVLGSNFHDEPSSSNLWQSELSFVFANIFTLFSLIFCPDLCLLTYDILFQQVGEEKLWLADEIVLAHFSSLKLESHAEASVCYPTLKSELQYLVISVFVDICPSFR